MITTPVMQLIAYAHRLKSDDGYKSMYANGSSIETGPLAAAPSDKAQEEVIIEYYKKELAGKGLNCVRKYREFANKFLQRCC